jgi:hypothetical protein
MDEKKILNKIEHVEGMLLRAMERLEVLKEEIIGEKQINVKINISHE